MSGDDRSHPAREPLALVGIGCRLPGGASSPDAFWRLLAAGDDAIVEVPPDRWNLQRWYHPDPATPGRMHVRHGGFLRESPFDWDAEFFRVAPREAARMDPQQRLLLEVAWEALEDAGLSHEALAGSRTGVFVGGFLLDSNQLQTSEQNLHLMDTHTSTGMTATMLAARLAWMFDLRGPAIAMDTACSSSLVALHLAATSLWQGECDTALVGGVNLMLSPWIHLSVVKAGLLAPDGHCKTFRADGDGYGRAEGAGVVVLKPLSAALAAGDAIYALVRGTAVNQDGRTPNGITSPSGEAQQRAMRAALASAGVRPADLQYVEAHGTGTAVGDPIETDALGAVLSEGRTTPCLIGSAKANIGHLEGASGVVGLIKAALCLSHGAVPPHRHLEDLNPKIDFAGLGLRLAPTLEPWPATSGARLAGVNSFGYGGTNAHAVLEAAPALVRVEAAPPVRPWILPLSARSDAALHALADRWIERLGADAPPMADLCHGAARRRGHHDRRLMVVADDAEGARALLVAFRAGETREGLVAGRARDRAPLVWVFTGMGPQWWAMGRELLAREPVFRAAVLAVDAELRRRTDLDLLGELGRPEDTSRMGSTLVAQTANFALQTGLAALWRSWGIAPDAVVGHSVGEVAAMYVAGALSFEDACWLSHERARLQARTAGLGGMLAAELPPDEAVRVIGHRGAEVSVAAINGPRSLTLAGDTVALDQIAALLTARGVYVKRLRVEVPYHSPVMDPLQDELLSVLSALRPRSATIPLYSTVYGRRIDGREVDAAYWWQNVRATVRFADAASALLEAGHEVFLEVGPHPVLGASIRECAGEGRRPVTAASLRREKPEQHTVLRALGALYTAGVPVDWANLVPAGNPVRLPSYPWQRQRHWVESAVSRDLRIGAATHPLLGLRVPGPLPAWEGDAGTASRSWLGDHAIEHQPILPAAAYLELALAAAREHGGAGPISLADVVLHRALALDRPVAVRVSLDPESDRFAIHSRHPREGAEWTLHASGRCRTGPVDDPPVPTDAETDVDLAADEVYARLADRGYHYGPAFRAMTGLRRGARAARADLALPEAVPEADRDGWLFHPSLLDGCLQCLLAVQEAPDGGTLGLHLPVGFRSLVLHRPAGPSLRCHGRITGVVAGETTADLRVVDRDGALVAEIRGAVVRALTDATSAALPPMYRFEWDPAPLDAAGSRPAGDGLPGTWVLLHDTDPLGPAVAGILARAGHRVVSVPRAGATGDDLVRVLAEAGPSVRGVLFLWGLARERATEPGARAIAGAGALLALVQAVVRGPSAPRLWIVTRGAQAVGDTLVSAAPDGAALWGLARVARGEHPALSASTIDLDPLPGGDDPTVVAAEILAASDEHEIAFRDGVRSVHRLRPYVLAAREPRVERVGSGEVPLVREDRSWQIVPEPVPQAGALAVRVHAGWLDAADGPALVVGEVLSAGGGFAVGDRVVALADRLGSRVEVAADRAVPLPDGLSPTAAAGLGAVLVAVHVLDGVARVRPGDRLRTGDVPAALSDALAAVAAARGVRLVDARQEADLVVGAGWPTTVALDGLARGGRWITLGPVGRAAFDPAALGARGLSLAVVDPAAALAHDAVATVRALQSALALGASVPVAPFPADRLSAAVEHAARGAATVIGFDDALVAATAEAGRVPVSGAGTYVVTGGLAGLGLAAAGWLVGLGARHLVLVSRRGADTPGAAEALDRLRARGATVEAVALDVTDAAAVTALVDRLGQGPHPLRGVLHAANVYGDWSTLDALAPAELARTMAPKVVGAWNLHRATSALDLDLFVVTSSILACIGGVGFGAYAAGNACLDALVHHRRALGQPGLAVAFGGIADVGLLEQDDVLAVRTARFGVRSLPAGRALAATAALLAAGEPQVAVADHDWRAWAAVHSGFAGSPEFAPLFASTDADLAETSRDSGPRTALLAAAPDERLHLLAAHLRRLTARVLGTAEDAIDLDLALPTLGIDSLMSTELKAVVQSELGLDVPILALIRGPSLHVLAASLLAQLVPMSSAAVDLAADELAALERELAAIEALSTTDVEAALGAPGIA